MTHPLMPPLFALVGLFGVVWGAATGDQSDVYGGLAVVAIGVLCKIAGELDAIRRRVGG